MADPTTRPTDLEILARCVYAVFAPSAEWPIHFYVEGRLEETLNEELDTVLAQAPPGWLGTSQPARNDTPIVLRIPALLRCPGSGEDVQLFLWLLRWCVGRQRAFSPSQATEVEVLEVSSDEMAFDLAKEQGGEATELQVKKAHAFLLSERLHSGIGGAPDDWTVTLSRKTLKPFHGVLGLEDYLAVVAVDERPQPPPAIPLLQEPMAAPVPLAFESPSAAAPEISLELTDLHPLVATACGRLFEGGHYSEGVLGAAKAMCKVVREKSGLTDPDDNTLIGRALRDKDPAIVVADLSTATGKNIQRGTMLLAQGILARLRNPFAHEEIELSRAEAMEMAALISRVVRDLVAADRGSGSYPASSSAGSSSSSSSSATQS